MLGTAGAPEEDRTPPASLRDIIEALYLSLLPAALSRPYVRTMTDITTFEDCRHLVDVFYGHIREEPLLGPVFASKIADWAPHLDTMSRFWFTILFGREAYHGNPAVKHVPLPIEREHFDRWLALWQTTIDAEFAGPIAENAKARAVRMADILESRVRERAGHPVA